ncbi:MFS transporter [Desulfatibacillum alkenivorans]|uniref:MFS transporter n=1 Tax=Desulfatibacillum alkenivorans TaxID=259354 RepID=UPI001FCDA538|nr:MFS transporter [Desulfatibacillum alkenivorans]
MERDYTVSDSKEYKKIVWSWCMYDWANSAFATTMMAAMYPPFFHAAAVKAGFTPSGATAAWGYFAAAALFIVAVSAPLLGAMADYMGRRKLFVGLFAGLGVLCTCAAVFLGDDTWLLAGLLFVGGNVGFAGANVFYESLLPLIAKEGDVDTISARGYALGYLGGGLLLVVNALMVVKPHWFGMEGVGFAVRASFFSVGVWWGVFSIPLLRNVPEPSRDLKNTSKIPIGEGIARLAATFRDIKKYKQLLIFLAAFWVYNDGIGTIIKMATAYGSEIGIGMTHLIGALVLTQFIGMPCAIAFGALASRIGAKACILIALGVYVIICIAGYFMSTPLHFYILAGLVGTVQGGSQALSRSLYAAMTPKAKASEFFGFFSSSAKMAGIAGPLVFGFVSQAAGESRLSIFSLIVFFAVGAILLLKVDVQEGIEAAKE